MNRLARKTEKKLYELFYTFFDNDGSMQEDDVIIKCLDFYDDFQPSRGDEVVTYKYRIHLYIKNKYYNYDGWCYDNETHQVALGVFSHWLVNNYKVYDGGSTAWYNMYTGRGNLTSKN